MTAMLTEKIEIELMLAGALDAEKIVSKILSALKRAVPEYYKISITAKITVTEIQMEALGRDKP